MKHRRYNGGIIRKLSGGKWQADFARGGDRERLTFDTETQAAGWLDMQAAVHARETSPASPIELAEIRRAREALAPGVSLSDLVAFWQRHHICANVPTPKEATAKFIAEHIANGVRDTYESHLRSLLAKLLALVPVQTLGDYTTDTLQDALLSLEVQAVTRETYRRVWSSFFQWCLARKWIVENPCAGLSRPRLTAKPPEIFSQAQVEALIAGAEANRPELVLFLALGFYAGLRTSELLQLDHGAIGPDYIRIDAAISKTRQRRLVPILPPLRVILDKYGKKKGPIVDLTRRLLFVRLSKLCPGKPHNCMRHTFISMRLAQLQNVQQVALEAGNSPNIIFRHYRELVSPETGKAYFLDDKFLPNSAIA